MSDHAAADQLITMRGMRRICWCPEDRSERQHERPHPRIPGTADFQRIDQGRPQITARGPQQIRQRARFRIQALELMLGFIERNADLTFGQGRRGKILSALEQQLHVRQRSV